MSTMPGGAPGACAMCATCGTAYLVSNGHKCPASQGTTHVVHYYPAPSEDRLRQIVREELESVLRRLKEGRL